MSKYRIGWKEPERIEYKYMSPKEQPKWAPTEAGISKASGPPPDDLKRIAIALEKIVELMQKDMDRG